MSEKEKIQSNKYGIASLVFGILGLYINFVFLLAWVRPSFIIFISFFDATLKKIFSIMGLGDYTPLLWYLLSLFFAVIAIVLAIKQRKIFPNKIEKTGFILGIIGTVFSIVFFFLIILSLWLLRGLDG